MNQFDPFLSTNSEELTPFELDMINEDLYNNDPGMIKFKDENNINNQSMNSKKVNNLNLPVANFNK